MIGIAEPATTGFHVGSRVRVAAIMGRVAFEMGLASSDIRGASTRPELCRARFAVCWLARHLSPSSLKAIGLVLGGRDHSTVLHAIRRGADLRTADAGFRAMTDRLAAELKPEEN